MISSFKKQTLWVYEKWKNPSVEMNIFVLIGHVF